MIGMLKRHEIEILLKAGHSQPEVARLSGVGLRSVRRIAREPSVVDVDDVAERAKRRIGRPNVVENFREQVGAILKQAPDLPSLEILRRVREAGYPGGKTALYELVASLRPPLAQPLVRFEGLPGEFSQHDFGQVEIPFLNDSVQRIHFFASRLKYSRYIVVRPHYSGGFLSLLHAYVKAKANADSNLIAYTLERMDYAYPYHQSIGFLMATAGFPRSQSELFKKPGLKYDFYLMHGMTKPLFDPEWKLHYPRGL
jgi:hypothetical protein